MSIGKRAIGAGLAVSMSFGAVSCSIAESPEQVIMTPETNLPPPIPLDGTLETIVCVQTLTPEECAEEDNLLASTITQERKVVSLDEISEAAIWGAIASEDREFYIHPGIALRGIVRAGVENVKDNLNIETLVDQDITFSQGASTITQQVIDDRYGLDLNDSIAEKIEEGELAMGLELALKPYCAYLLDIPSEDLYPGGIYPAYEQDQIDGCGKDFILTDYFNRKNFGRDSDGIQDAALKTFDKDAKDINAPQALILDANLQSPSNTDMTSTDPDILDDEISRNQARYETIVKDLFQGGKIDQSEADLLIRAYNNETVEYGPSALSTVVPYTPSPGGIDTLPARDICAEHLSVRTLYEAADVLDVTYADVATRGYTIVTYTDKDMQKEACEGVRDINDNSDGYEGAMTAVAKDRTLLAMVGGENREENQVNLATGAEGGGDGGDDWGSVRKAIIAAMALKNGMDPNQTFTVNNETPIPGASNDDGSPYIVDTRSGCRQLNKGEGSCEQSVYEILGVSSNTGAAEMMLTSGSEPTFGADEVYELDRKLGGDIQGEVVPSVVVGSGGGSTKGFANLFVNLTLNEGRAPYREGEEEPEDPFSVDRIYNSEGILVWSHVRDRLPFLEEKQVLDEQVANDTTQLLRAPEEASYGTASNAFNLPSDKVAVKTGSATGGTDVTVAAAMSDSEIGATSEGENGGVAVAWWVGYPNYTNPETGEINRLPEGFSSGDLARIAGIHLTKVGVSDDNSLLPGDSTRVISR